MSEADDEDQAGDSHSSETPAAVLAELLRDLVQLAAEVGSMGRDEIREVVEELLDELAAEERTKFKLVDGEEPGGPAHCSCRLDR